MLQRSQCLLCAFVYAESTVICMYVCISDSTALLCHIVSQLLRMECWSPNPNCGFVYFSFQLYQVLLHVTGRSDGWCVRIQDCVSLAGWSISYVVTLTTNKSPLDLIDLYKGWKWKRFNLVFTSGFLKWCSEWAGNMETKANHA